MQTNALIEALEMGEKSAKIRNFNREDNLKQLNEIFQKQCCPIKNLNIILKL
jgi:hypothetical protein